MGSVTVIAVVGATGYLGRSVVLAAADRDWTVVTCSRSGVANAWRDLGSRPLDVVVNCAGAGMDSGERHRGSDLLEANLLVPVSAASLALRTGARLVHIGSAAQQSERLVHESPYVQSKKLASDALRLLGNTDGLNGIELLPHIIYGGENSTGVVDAMVRSIADGKPFALRTPHVQRDFVHLYDVTRAVIAACESGSESWQSVEIGTGEGHTLEEAAAIIGGLAGVDDSWCQDPGPGRVWETDLVADPRPASAALGFSTEIPLEVGLEPIVRKTLRGLQK